MNGRQCLNWKECPVEHGEMEMQCRAAVLYPRFWCVTHVAVGSCTVAVGSEAENEAEAETKTLNAWASPPPEPNFSRDLWPQLK